MMFRKATILAAAFASLPFLAQAHEGHGHFHGYQLAHYLTSPAHAIPLALALIAGIAFFWSRRAKADNASRK